MPISGGGGGGGTASPAPLVMLNTVVTAGGEIAAVTFGSSGTLLGSNIFLQYMGGVNNGSSYEVIINASGGGSLATISIPASGSPTITPTGAGPATIVAGESTMELICTSPDSDVNGASQMYLTLMLT